MQLKFEIKNQRIYRADNEKPVAGSVGYLTAQFTFSADWDGLVKTAIFRAGTDTPYEVLIAADGTCEVATQAIVSDTMFVSVRGDSVTGDTVFLPTAANEVQIYAAGAVSGETPTDPSPDIYAQILRAYTAPFPGDNGNWWYYDSVTGEFVDSGIFVDLTISTAARDEAVAAAGVAIAKAEAALNSERNAKGSETVAGEAAAYAEEKRIAAVKAQGAAEDAQGKAENAQEGAETAQGKAENAQTAAAGSATAAAGSATGANGAKTAAQTAKTGAETAQGKAETARDEAKDYAESIYLWQKAPTLETMDFAIMLYPPLLASI